MGPAHLWVLEPEPELKLELEPWQSRINNLSINGVIYCMELFRLWALHIVPNNDTFLFLPEYLFVVFIQGKAGNAILSSS